MIELIIVVALALLILYPKKVPSIARSLGRALSPYRKARKTPKAPGTADSPKG